MDVESMQLTVIAVVVATCSLGLSVVIAIIAVVVAIIVISTESCDGSVSFC